MLAEFLKVNKVLHTLSLDSNKIGDDGAKEIAAALKVNQSIKRIYIQGDWIPVASFRDGKTTNMDLSRKGYNELSAIIIASLLTVNTSLATLVLYKNMIGDAGAAAIAKALQVNKTLTSLSLSYNGIGDTGTKAIGEALRVNQTLRELNLRFNKIGDDGANAIGEALKVNQSIKRIYIQCDWIPVASFRDGKTTNMDLSRKGYNELSAIIIASLLTINPILKQLDGVNPKDHIQGLPHGVSDNKRILEYLREQHKINEAAAKKKAEEEAKKDAYEALRRELEALKLNLAEQKRLRGKLDSVVSAYRHVRAERNQGSSGLVLTAQWRKWLFVLQRFKDSPPRDPWQQANCDGLLQLEANLEHALAGDLRTPQQCAKRDSLCRQLAAEVEALLQLPPAAELQDWEALVGHLNDTDGAQNAKDAPSEGASASTLKDASTLVRAALDQHEQWAQGWVSQLADLQRASDTACAALVVGMDQLSSALTGQPESGKVPDSLQLQPLLQDLWQASEAEKDIPAAAKYWQASFPTASLLRALGAIREAVNWASQGAEALRTLQERLRDMLPILQAERPETTKLKELDKNYKELKKKVHGLAYDVEHWEENEDQDGLLETKAELSEKRTELAAVVKTRQRLLARCIQLVDQFPEMLLPESEHFVKGLQNLVESCGLDMGSMSLNDFTEVKPISNDRHSVFKVRADFDSEWFALKEYKLSKESNWTQMLKEVKLLKLLEHPNVVQVVCAFYDRKRAGNLGYLQMPFYERTLADCCDGKLAVDEHQAQAMMREVLRGVEHIHRLGVVHCDLKPANIFLAQQADSSWQPEIGDFDVSMDTGKRATWAATIAITTAGRGFAGTPNYVAPEVLQGQRASFASDMFSFGLILFDLHFPGSRADRPSAQLLLAGRAFSPPSHSNQQLRKLLESLLQVDPAKRPSSTNALAHPFFNTSLLLKQEKLHKEMTQLQKDRTAAFEMQRQLEASRIELEQKQHEEQTRIQRKLQQLEEQESKLQQEITTERKRLEEQGAKAMKRQRERHSALLEQEKALTAQRAELVAQDKSRQKKEQEIKQQLQYLQREERKMKEKQEALEQKKKELLKCQVLAAPPMYWASRSLRLDQPCRLVDAKELEAQVQELMKNTCISAYIGIGRDSHGLRHKGFRVVRVQRVENPQLWSKYQIEREAVRANMPRPPAKVTLVDSYNGALWKRLQVDSGVNEALLWHGTKADLWEVIAKQGLDERLAGNGLFGHGIYFAENSSKSDEYIVPDRQGNSYIFLARVCLGVPCSTLQSTNGMRRPPPRSQDPPLLYDSVRAECKHHAKFPQPGAYLERYREFIVFDRKLTYPEILVTFQRV
eukprot:g62136.t1